ncbi:MAG TPA: MarR family transcriptional regulator [Rhodanobacteraceae bacterium]|nr:MarR family transcriptional regulator [Rhodanobacteraceae bacterium]
MNQSADNTLFYMLHDVTRQIRKHFDRRATRLELTRAQWRALKVTSRQEGLSQSELAEHLDMEAIPVGRVIDRLEKTGFIERRADPADRRRWRLYLTPKAHAVVGEMEVIAGELRDDALRGIERNDLDTLMGVLNRIKENLATLDASQEEERKVS